MYIDRTSSPPNLFLSKRASAQTISYGTRSFSNRYKIRRNMTNPNHSRLFEQFRAGSLPALHTYCNRYAASVYLFLVDATGDETMAWEKARQVFVRLYKKRRKIKEEAQLPSFLHRIMKDLAGTTYQDGMVKKWQLLGCSPLL